MGAHVLPLSSRATCATMHNTWPNTWPQRPSPSKRQKLPLPPKAPALPPPPKAPPPLYIELRKYSTRERLGVRFLAEGDKGGAVIESVEPYGLAWRAKLRPGDVVTTIVHGDKEMQTGSGHRAAEVLRPLQGVIGLRMLRERMSRADVAACRLQAAFIGHQVRLGFDDARRASLKIQTHFRRWEAQLYVHECLLAVRYIQDLARDYLEHRRATGGARSSIRAPATLDFE